MARYKHIGTIVLMTAGALPFIGLLVWANLAQTRSADDLAVADRCVDWAHKNRDVRQADGPEIQARCDRYFRVRSEKDAEEDDRRWDARAAR
jgi:hypothetical protein